jgi:hypothetical protein
MRGIGVATTKDKKEPKYPFNAEQMAILKDIEADAEAMADKEVEVKDIRDRLQAKLEAAKAANLSSYVIAKSANISQPRVMQILKELADAAKQ